MKKYISTVITAFALLSSSAWSAEVEVLDHPEIPTILQELPHYGVLTQREKDGAIYLKVSEEYLDKLFCIITEMYGENLDKGSSVIGAHVSVIRPSIGEPVFRNIPELNQTFDFEPLFLGTVVPNLDPKWERVWILVIRADSLENLRTSYGLSPRVGDSDNEFHITIATKLRENTNL